MAPPSSSTTSTNHAPPTKIRSLKLQFRPPGSSRPNSPSSSTHTPPPQAPQQPTASSSKKDKPTTTIKKKKSTTHKKSSNYGTPRNSPAPGGTLLTAGTSSRPQIHQIVRKPPPPPAPAKVFAAEPTAGFGDDDGNSTLSELTSDESLAGGDDLGAAGADDEMEVEPRWDEEFNGAWERRRGSFPSDDERRRMSILAGGLGGGGNQMFDDDETSSDFDEDMDDSDDDLSGSEGGSDGIRVLTFDSNGARVLLGSSGPGGGGPGDGDAWSEDSSEADDEDEELWFEDYEQFGTGSTNVDPMQVDDDGSYALGGPSSSSLFQLPPVEPSSQQQPPSNFELDHQGFSALDFLNEDEAAEFEDLHQPGHPQSDGLHMLEDMDGQLIFSALADALGNLGSNEKGGNIFEWATESEGDSDGSRDAARLDDLWAESDFDEDHYFGDEEGDTTDSLPEDEVDEAIKRSLLEEEALPPIPSLTMSASLARQLASHSDTHSNGSLVSPALSFATPVPLQVPPSAAPSPMDVLNPSPPPIPQPTTTSRSPSIVSESATISSAGHPSRPRPPVPPSTAAILASLKKTPTAKPTMGCFIPAETTPAHFKSVIIDGVEDRKGGAPPTPFTRRKAENARSRSRGRSQSNLKTGSTGRRRDIFNKHPFVPKTKRTRYGSSPSARNSPRRLPLREETPSSPDVEPVSLEDVLDPSLFHHGLPSSTSDPALHATSTDRERYLADQSSRNLNRWDRVSIGTFRGRLSAGGGGGGGSTRGVFGGPPPSRPGLNSHHHHSSAQRESPSKPSIFRSGSGASDQLEVPTAGPGGRSVISPVFGPAAGEDRKDRDRELEGFVL